MVSAFEQGDIVVVIPTPNGLRYLRVGGRGQNFESRILFGRGKCLKTEQNPSRPVHAVLGAVTFGETVRGIIDNSSSQEFDDNVLDLIL